MIHINYNVDEENWKKNFPHFKKCIAKSVNETFEITNTKNYYNTSVTFFLTSNKKIRELNYKYRNKNKSTNVLSFPMQSTFNNNYLLGDIALANQTLIKEAAEQNITKYDYLCMMTIHGMLHLLGYDHVTEKQFKKMKSCENQIFNSIKKKL
tara:strand:+ start:592 stop:1047 length:456 start_codon:yes stop_codon:yes gene_type:complete